MTESLSHRQTLRALAISCGGLSLLGTLYVMAAWLPASPEIGMRRSALFVVLMVAIHALGGALYLAQRANSLTISLSPVTLSATARNAVRSAILQQTIVVGVSLLMLDGGFAIRGCHVAVAATAVHWLLISLILLRRADAPSVSDLALIRFSLPVLCVLGTLIVQPFQHGR